MILEEVNEFSLEKYYSSEVLRNPCDVPVTFSAKTFEALLQDLYQQEAYLHSNLNARLYDLAYTRNVKRTHYNEHRLSFISDTTEDLLKQLQSVLRTKELNTKTFTHSMSLYGNKKQFTNKQKSIVFQFSGQGSQHPQMGKNFMRTIRHLKWHWMSVTR